MEKAFVSVMQRVLREKEAITAACRETLEGIDTAELDAEVARLENEANSVAERLRKLIEENARVRIEQAEYQREYDALAAEYERINKRIQTIEAHQKDNKDYKRRIEVFLWVMMKREECNGFDPYTFVTLVEKVVVEQDGKLMFHFRGGKECTTDKIEEIMFGLS